MDSRSFFVLGIIQACSPISIDGLEEKCCFPVGDLLQELIDKRYITLKENIITKVDTSTRLPWRRWIEECKEIRSLDGFDRFQAEVFENDHDYESTAQAIVSVTIAAFEAYSSALQASGFQTQYALKLLSDYFAKERL